MILIESTAELDAVSGGAQPAASSASRVKCTATASKQPSVVCEGSLADWGGSVLDLFSGLNEAGARLGRWIYDVTH